MKKHFNFTLLSSVIILAGCAHASPSIVLAPVGPDLRAPIPAQGTLMVYSGVNVYQNSDPTNDYSQYSDYEIWTQDGSKRLSRVRNHGLPFASSEPTAVKLQPGRYLVKAMAEHYSDVTVPVVIEAERMTTVHLDGRGKTEKSQNSPSTVYLPNGEAVGSRSSEKS